MYGDNVNAMTVGVLLCWHLPYWQTCVTFLLWNSDGFNPTDKHIWNLPMKISIVRHLYITENLKSELLKSWRPYKYDNYIGISERFVEYFVSRVFVSSPLNEYNKWYYHYYYILVFMMLHSIFASSIQTEANVWGANHFYVPISTHIVGIIVQFSDYTLNDAFPILLDGEKKPASFECVNPSCVHCWSHFLRGILTIKNFWAWE